nr:unnamed protein product [Leishmania braziliensis]
MCVPAHSEFGRCKNEKIDGPPLLPSSSSSAQWRTHVCCWTRIAGKPCCVSPPHPFLSLASLVSIIVSRGKGRLTSAHPLRSPPHSPLSLSPLRPPPFYGATHSNSCLVGRMLSWSGRASVVRCTSVAAHCPAAATSKLLFYSSQRNGHGARDPHRDSLLPHAASTAAPAPAAVHTQRARARKALKRTSLLEQLLDCNGGESGTEDLSKVPSGDGLVASATAASPSVPVLHPAAAMSPAYITSSEFASAPIPKQPQHVWPPHRTHSAAAAAPLPSPAASAELQRQQQALRDAFTHARQHHNVRLAKDPGVYRAECRAFRQAHQGRSPTQQEVSRIVAVPLAPVAALKTLAHVNGKRSSLHATTEAAVMLHNAVVKNELVKSNTPQLVRCLRCFHVYAARPRTLWGGEVEQSFTEYEKAQKAQQHQRTAPGKRARSVGRRRRAYEDDPICCPKCRSPRAQWMMEYVHHHTHERV